MNTLNFIHQEQIKSLPFLSKDFIDILFMDPEPSEGLNWDIVHMTYLLSVK